MTCKGHANTEHTSEVFVSELVWLMAKISCQLTTAMHATFPRQTTSDRSTQRPVHSKDLCFVDWIPWVTPEAETSNGAMSALACKDET